MQYILIILVPSHLLQNVSFFPPTHPTFVLNKQTNKSRLILIGIVQLLLEVNYWGHVVKENWLFPSM